MGKGSKLRARDNRYCSREQYNKNFDAIFNNKDEKEQEKKEDEQSK